MTSSSVGAAYGATILLGTGPVGWLVGAGACVALALNDYFFGDKVASIFFKEDPEEVERLIKAKYNKLEKEVIASAYDLLNLTAHCTNEELKAAFRAAVLKYHPDKCQGSEEERQKKHRITQGIVAAYTLLKEERGM